MTGLLSKFRRGDALAVPSSGPPLPPASPPEPAQAVNGPPLPPKPELLRAETSLRSASAELRRLLIGFDATESRKATWKEAARLMDTLLTTLPGKVELSLAAHGGGRLHTVTRYTTDARKLRQKAAEVYCEAGYTRMLDILAHAAALKANLIIYVGDAFEESPRRARKIADKLGRLGIRVIILQEGSDGGARDAFAEIAERTGGALLPFDISSFDRIGKELLELVAVLAVGGVEAVKAKAATMPAATTLLLENLDPKRLLIGQAKS
jgi:hypothetical protein